MGKIKPEVTISGVKSSTFNWHNVLEVQNVVLTSKNCPVLSALWSKELNFLPDKFRSFRWQITQLPRLTSSEINQPFLTLPEFTQESLWPKSNKQADRPSYVLFDFLGNWYIRGSIEAALLVFLSLPAWAPEGEEQRRGGPLFGWSRRSSACSRAAGQK